MAEAKPVVRGRDGSGAARARRRVAALTLAALLGGCAVGGPLSPPAPLGFAEADRARGDATLPGAAGPLAASIWRPEGAARAVILAVHGYGDHAHGTYAEAAEYWAEAGIATYAYDQRGFGRNPDHGFWPGDDGLIEDFAAAAAALRRAHPDLPLIAVGHSMGGGVVLAAMGEGRAPGVDAAVLAGPAINGSAQAGPLSRIVAWSAAAVLPDRRWTGEGLVSFQASDDIDLLRRMAADPLHINTPSARELLGLIRVMDRAEAAAPRVSAPVLILHGERDELVSLRGVRGIAERMGAPLTVYPEGWHLLFGDLQKRVVWRDVADFALSFAPSEPPTP
ncbi:MAG: alpha/beta fold hydrolase [Rubrimonas sp.]